MKESIKIIIKSIFKALMFFLIITLGTLIFVYFVYKISAKQDFKSISPKIGINNRQININILEDKILFEDIIVFEKHRALDENARYYFINSENLGKVKMVLEHINSNSISSSMVNKGYVELSENFLKFVNNFAKVRLNYEVDKDFLIRYNDTDFLSLFISTGNIDYIENLKITLKADSKISDLVVKRVKNSEFSKEVEVDYINGEYVIIIDNIDVAKRLDVDMTFKIDDELNNIVESNFIDNKKINEEFKNTDIDRDTFSTLNKFDVFTFILLIISYIINKKIKIKSSSKEVNDLISPVLAEGIVDKKIGIKEIIMTTIAELNIKGNIRIINNEVLELLSTENIEFYEKEIIELLFKENKIIKLKDINKIFIESNVKTAEFSKKINLIKNLITDKLFSENIFSRRLTVINKLISMASILIIINVIYLFFMPTETILNLVTIFSFYYFIYCIVTYIKKYIKEKISITQISLQDKIANIDKTFYSKNGSFIIIFVALVLVVFLLYIISIIKINLSFLVKTVFVILLNIFIINLSNNIVLTTKGKEEQIKLLRLKNYINDYSLIKNRDLESVIIWDEYFAYAIAFGIPNKVVNSICEDWYDVNIKLQMFAKIVY